MKRVAFAVFLGCAAFSIASAPILAPVLAPVTIKRTPTKGQKYSYAVAGKVTFSGMDIDISNKETDSIIDVAADGTYTQEAQQSDMQINGQPSPQPPSGPSKTVIKPNGEVVSVSAPDAPSNVGRLAVLTAFYYPDKPVDVNDTWSFTGKKDDKLGSEDFKADLKYLGMEKVGSVDTYKVQEDAKETSGTAPATMHTTVWVDASDGSMVKAVANFTDLPVQADITVSGTLTYTRN